MSGLEALAQLLAAAWRAYAKLQIEYRRSGGDWSIPDDEGWAEAEALGYAIADAQAVLAEHVDDEVR